MNFRKSAILIINAPSDRGKVNPENEKIELK